MVREPDFPPTSQTAAVEGGLPNGDAGNAHLLNPAESRHFVYSVLPDGPIGRLNIVRPGDELLQVLYAGNDFLQFSYICFCR